MTDQRKPELNFNRGTICTPLRFLRLMERCGEQIVPQRKVNIFNEGELDERAACKGFLLGDLAE